MWTEVKMSFERDERQLFEEALRSIHMLADLTEDEKKTVNRLVEGANFGAKALWAGESLFMRLACALEADMKMWQNQDIPQNAEHPLIARPEELRKALIDIRAYQIKTCGDARRILARAGEVLAGQHGYLRRTICDMMAEPEVFHAGWSKIHSKLMELYNHSHELLTKDLNRSLEELCEILGNIVIPAGKSNERILDYIEQLRRFRTQREE